MKKFCHLIEHEIHGQVLARIYEKGCGRCELIVTIDADMDELEITSHQMIEGTKEEVVAVLEEITSNESILLAFALTIQEQTKEQWGFMKKHLSKIRGQSSK